MSDSKRSLHPLAITGAPLKYDFSCTSGAPASRAMEIFYRPFLPNSFGALVAKSERLCKFTIIWPVGAVDFDPPPSPGYLGVSRPMGRLFLRAGGARSRWGEGRLSGETHRCAD